MVTITRFNDYLINESLGVAEATLYYSDIITSSVFSEVLDFIDSDPATGTKNKIQIDIPFSKIRKYVTDWNLYKYFPVSEISIEVTLIKSSSDKVTSTDIDKEEIYQVPIKIGGYASPFAVGREKAATRIKDPIKTNTDHSVSIHMGIDVEVSTIFNKRKHEKVMETKIESVVLHELNHTYEAYMRKMSGRKKIGLAMTWAAIGSNDYKRPKNLWLYWQAYFTDYVYMAEPHEVRAQIQEAKAYVNKLDFKAFQETRTWKIAKVMQNFSSKSFIDRFNKIIIKHNPEYIDKIIETFVKDFTRDYRKLTEINKEDNSIKPEFLEKLTTEEFFDFFEKKIRKAGTALYKKISRLYALKKREDEDYINYI